MKIEQKHLTIEFSPVEFDGRQYTNLSARMPSFSEKTHGQRSSSLGDQAAAIDYIQGLVAVCTNSPKDLIAILDARVVEAFSDFLLSPSVETPKSGKRA